MNTAQSIFENERRNRRLKLFHIASVNDCLSRHHERSEGSAVADPRHPRNPRPSIFGWQSNFDLERQARLARQRRFFRVRARLGRLKEVLREHAWELNALVIFFLLIGVAVFFMSRTLAELDHVHELQREIEILRALAS